MSGNDCPPQNELTDYISGKIVPPRAEEIDAHLDSCPRCHETLDNLQLGEDQMTAQFRKPVEAKFVEESACDAALDQVLHPPQDSAENSEEADLPTIVGGEKQTAREIESSESTLGQLREYELLEKLGEGGMGAVYKARHSKLGKIVALKILPDDKMQDAAAVNRFEREMRAVGSLNHPHIVGASDAGEFEGQHYLVMEYVEGIDLSALVKQQKRLRIADACELIRQAALGLQHVHEIGLVHRDIKPSNIMLTTTGQVKVLDLGLALLDETHLDVQAELTTTGQIMGTVDYMAPEQGSDTHGVDIRADLYSLGATLFKLLTGKAPFQNKKYDSMMKRLMALANEPAPPVTAIRKEVPEKLANIIAKLLAKDPAQRFQTPAELATALEPFCEKSDLVALMGGETIIAKPVEAAPLIQVAPDTGRIAQPPRRKVGLAMWGFFAALLLGVITIATKEGTVTIKTPDNQKLSDTVQVKIKPLAGGDKEVTVLDKNGNWTASLASGEYTLDLVGGNDEFDLTDNTLSVSRFGTTFVEIAYTPKNVASGDAQLHGDAAGKSWHGWPADAPAPAIAPFDAEQAKQHQEAWAKYLGVPVEYENSIGMKFRLIPPGEFNIGTDPDELDELQTEARQKGVAEWYVSSMPYETPQRHVVLTQPYYVSTTEVTNAQFHEFVRDADYRTTVEQSGLGGFVESDGKWSRSPDITWDSPGFETKGDLPVVQVSLDDAIEFSRWLSEQESGPYRVLTDAEWKFAARAGMTTRYVSGDDETSLTEHAWFEAFGVRQPQPVGKKKQNAFGLNDMLGNVWEWCSDFAHAPELQQPVQVNPSGPDTGVQHLLNGGCWNDLAFMLRIDSFHTQLNDYSNWAFGMRIGMEVEDARASLRQRLEVSRSDAPAPAIAPFDADQARKHQEAWAKYLGVPVEYTNSIGMKFRLIPPGEFLMGSTPEEIAAALLVRRRSHLKLSRESTESEAPQHKVILTQASYVGIHEVKQSQYEQVMGTNPSYFSVTGAGKKNVANLNTQNYPVELIHWYDAAEFCAKLSAKEELKPYYLRSGKKVTPLKGTGYRLPTEAEWEFACRAGTTTRFSTGDSDSSLVPATWFGEARGRTHAVGELTSNPFGLYDMHGNLAEWVEDAWDPAFYFQFADIPAINPRNPSFASGLFVSRGGAWWDFASYCRSSSRFASNSHISNSIGFRVVLTVDAVKAGLKNQEPTAIATNRNNSSGYALSFDGVDDYVELPMTYDGNHAHTIEAWLDPDQPTDNAGTAISSAGMSIAYHKFPSNQKYGWQIHNELPEATSNMRGHPAGTLIGPYQKTVAETTHIAVVYDQKSIRLFENGKIVGWITGKPFEKIVHHNPYRIGRSHANDLAAFFKGTIDEVRISNTARYSKDFTPQQRFEPDKNTLALYHFDEGEGNVLKDSSVNGHDGKIYGATWVKTGDSPASNDPERELAEWVIEQGGTVSVRLFDKPQSYVVNNLRTVEQLPTSPFTVWVIDLHELKSIDDAAIRILRSLCLSNEVYVLNLDNTSVSDDVTEILAGMSIYRFNLSYLGLSDLAALALTDIRDLHRLTLAGNDFTDSACSSIGAIPTLEQLDLSDTHISDRGIEHLERLPNLSDLQLRGVQLTERGMASIARQKSFRSVSFQYTKLSDRELKALENSTIVHLDLGGGQHITHDGLRSLTRIKTLRGLNLEQMGELDNEGVRLLAESIPLDSLSMRSRSIDDQSTEALSRMKTLSRLSVTACDFSDAGIQRLAEAMPQCRIKWDGGVIHPHGTEADRKVAEWMLTRNGVATLLDNGQTQTISSGDRLPNSNFCVTEVKPSDKDSIDHKIFQELITLRSLTKLHLPNVSLTDEQLKRVMAIPTLQEFTVTGDNLTNRLLLELMGHPSLRGIALNHTGVTDDGLRALTRCHALNSVTLHPEFFTARGIEYLNQIPLLQHVRVIGASSQDLKHLPRLSRIKSLQFSYTKEDLIATDIEKLHGLMPWCNIRWDDGDLTIEAEPELVARATVDLRRTESQQEFQPLVAPKP